VSLLEAVSDRLDKLMTQGDVAMDSEAMQQAAAEFMAAAAAAASSCESSQPNTGRRGSNPAAEGEGGEVAADASASAVPPAEGSAAPGTEGGASMVR
jgi:hypothetical protein